MDNLDSPSIDVSLFSSSNCWRKFVCLLNLLPFKNHMASLNFEKYIYENIYIKSWENEI